MRQIYRKLYNKGKHSYEITWHDFMVYPIWSDCLELEYKFGEDFFAPIVPSTKIPTSKKILYDLGICFLMVREKFILANGTILDGIIVIDSWNKTLYGISLK